MRTNNKALTDEQVEMEIARLNESEEVKLARLEQTIKYRRRQYLYQLRYYEKRGRELIKAGVTEESLRSMDVGLDNEEE